MTIVMTGGGSGGHITPILAVAAEIKRLKPDARIVYIGQKGDGLSDIPANDPNIDQVFSVPAGKFRRYNGEGLKQLLDISTVLKNIRDIGFVVAGLWQSRKLMKQLNPTVLFVCGGFVGVPVGLAAAAQQIPFITHDSNSVPGLANKILARWADIHAVALPEDVYNYPRDKTITTGIPLSGKFVAVTPALKQRYRQSIGLPDSAQLLFVIGGGLGSQRLNGAVTETIGHLLDEFKHLHLVHVVGRANRSAMEASYKDSLSSAQQARITVFGFIEDVYRYSGAADVVVTRAGATNLAEFALQGKACIVVPSPFLTAGHQLKNAHYLTAKNAAITIDEVELMEDPNRLARQISSLLKDTVKRHQLGVNFRAFAKPDAAQAVARLLLGYPKTKAVETDKRGGRT